MFTFITRITNIFVHWYCMCHILIIICCFIFTLTTRISNTFMYWLYMFHGIVISCYFVITFTAGVTKVLSLRVSFDMTVEASSWRESNYCFPTVLIQSNFHHCQLASFYWIKFFMCCVILTLKYSNEKCLTICMKFGNPSLKKWHKLRPSLIRLPTWAPHKNETNTASVDSVWKNW